MTTSIELISRVWRRKDGHRTGAAGSIGQRIARRDRSIAPERAPERQPLPVDKLPFGPGDATAGAENEWLTTVRGLPETVDLPRTLRESNFYQNLLRRAAAGDAPRRLVRALEDHVENNPTLTWENSWVVFRSDVLTAYAREVMECDLHADKSAPGRRRSDAGRFLIRRDGEECIRVPVSYLLKLALAQVVSVNPATPPEARRLGDRMMRHFVSDNTSPETFSFYPVADAGGPGLGRALADETQRRYLLMHLLTVYAADRFGLSASGQEPCVGMAPQTPRRQHRLNELVSDSFYRDLFMSPCLSGWDCGETKHQYMILCHEVLSRSRLHTMAKLRECGILARNLVTLPTVSNTSLANNGTHVSLGSRRLTLLRAAGDPAFSPLDEKRLGDLVVKIVEHFLPLFVGTYSAAPFRLDFHDFHPETVLGFLPHEVDFTHLRMLWRRWKGKADLRRGGMTWTPLGPRRLDGLIGGLLGLRGDWIPDQRLIDYLVSPLSTDRCPALDGTPGNDERLKRDLAEMGVFDTRMSFYSLYRQRHFAAMGFCGFEGRYYSQFSNLQDDLARAVDLQRLITALAYRYALNESVTHADIPDTPDVESERRHIFFGQAIGLPTFFARANTDNRFLARLLGRTARVRNSHRYPGRLRVYHQDYRLALLDTIATDGADLVDALELQDTIADLKDRLNPAAGRGALAALRTGILNEAGAAAPLRVRADAFNAAAERFYGGPLRRRFIADALALFERDLATMPTEQITRWMTWAGTDVDPVALLRAVRADVIDGRPNSEAIRHLIMAMLLVIEAQGQRHGSGL